MTYSSRPVTMLPYKSVAAALLFAAILGPVGLLYSSFWGGFLMILVGAVVLSGKQIVPVMLVWVISCVWAVKATDQYNKKIFNTYLQ